jgi:hypothetical protein
MQDTRGRPLRWSYENICWVIFPGLRSLVRTYPGLIRAAALQLRGKSVYSHACSEIRDIQVTY